MSVPLFRRSSLDKSLHVYYQNVRGLRTKIDCFFMSVSSFEYDVVVLTETWLDDCIFSSQLFGDMYSVYRTNRSHLTSRKKRGGGVLIAVNNKLTSHVDPAAIDNRLEQLWVKIKLPDYNVSIGVIYLPPDLKNNIDSIQQHIDSVGSITSRLNDNDPALLFGDYNQSGLVWKTAVNDLIEIDSSRSSLTGSSGALLDGMSFHGYNQINPVCNSINGRSLDLLFANICATTCSTVYDAVDSLVPLDVYYPAL